MTQKSRLFASLGALCDEIGNQKSAAAKVMGKAAGATPADPGFIGGSSSHPTASADNGCQTATEGSRSSENEADVKDQQGAPSVNSTPEATPGADKDKSLNLGTKATLTGDDPSVEDDYKGDKDDPGTSHPATTEDGQKYSSFKKHAAAAINIGNSLLADLAVGAGVELPNAKPAATNKAAGAAPAATKPAQAANLLAGYELANVIGLNKTAAEAHVADTLAQAAREGREVGDMVGAFLRKKAADEAEAASGEDHTEGGKPEEGGSGANPSSGTGGESGGSSGAGSSAEGGAAPAPGGGGANPLASIMGGGGGDMGGGAPAPGGMGGMGGGEPSLEQQPASPDEALQELAMALQELGIPLDQLAQMGAAGGGAPGGMGAPPAPGGMGAPPAGPDPLAALGGGGAPPMGEGAKLASAVRNFMKSGKFQIKEARTKRARELRDEMKAHIRELAAA